MVEYKYKNKEVILMKYIQGDDRCQPTLLPTVLDDYINENNPARVIDAFVDSLDMLELGFNKVILSETGRPPYSPNDLLKLFIYGYFNKVRSSRKLEIETHRNVEVMWLLNNLKPDHKTISRFRKDNLIAIKNVFNNFVKLCLKMNLYNRQLISIDGSHFAAVNSKERNFTKAKLQDRIARINTHIAAYLTEIENNDNEENRNSDNENVVEIIEILKTRKIKYETMLDTLEETSEKQISLTDPDSRRLIKHNSSMVAYNVQTAVDDGNSLIVDFEVVNTVDKGNMHKLAIKCKNVLETNQLTSLADKGYISSTDIANCISDNIDANVCMDEKSLDFCIETDEVCPKPTTYENGRIVYLKNRNLCVCPMGEVLYPGTYRNTREMVRFYNYKACAKCLKKCTTAKFAAGEIPIKKSEFSREYNDKNLLLKQIHYTPDKELLKLRKSLSEHPFGIVKRCLGADYLLMKRFSGVTAEVALAFLAFNMKRVINILGVEKIIKAIQA